MHAGMVAETAERDRIRECDASRIDQKLEAQDLAPLLSALERLQGWDAGTLAKAETAVEKPCRARRPALAASAAALTAEPTNAFEVSGKVKFFDSIKRFGFIVPDDGQGDVLLHVSCLRAAGHATVHAGARIQALAYNGPKGLQVLRVISMDESTAIDPAQLAQRTRAKVEPESEWEVMVVRWYNVERGYGFVHCGEGTPDVFVHAETLRRWGVGALRPGQAVEVRWGTTGKGRMVAEIRLPRGPVH